MRLKKKCRNCPVQVRRGGCLFGCNKKERLSRELQLLIEDAESHIDPLVEQLRQCPEAFNAGKAVEGMFRMLRSDDGTGDQRLLPPPGSIISPFV
ncbi:MAG TPA: hypothetical protein VFK06_17805 [Candidatus Angelobacter sp.]|nr:hypothetical protein [Candidatus Angelobacter sp.]